MVWSHELLLLLQVLLLFVGLSGTYWVVFKRVQWQSVLMRTLIARIHLSAYLLVPLIPLAWGLSEVTQIPKGSIRISGRVVQLSGYALLIVATIFVVEACNALVFEYLFAARRRVIVPQILRSLVRGIVYVLAFLVLLPRVFGLQQVAGLLTSSAILSIILGLALQETLGNLFAGIGMQIARPYAVGHWVKISTYEGVVERADWRSVTIRTLRGDHVSFPHSFVAKLEIHNYSLPSPLHAREVQVGVHYRHPPFRVEEVLLRCARETPGVCTQPPPLVRLTAYQDFTILYTLKIWLDDFARHQDIESDVLKRLWYALKREGIQIPFPIQDVYHHKGDVFTDAVIEHMEMLKDIEFLKVLTDEQVRQLARRLDPLIFARGETICRQGEAGETFYIVKSGVVEVSAYNGQGHRAVLRRMGPGDFFGEISLMTGEPRSATVTAVQDTEVLMMDKEDMRYLLEENSQLAEHVSSVLASRQQQLEEQRTRQTQDVSSSSETQRTHVESLRREFLGRIRRFFAH